MMDCMVHCKTETNLTMGGHMSQTVSPRSTADAAVVPRPKLSRQALLAALDQGIRPVRIMLLYRLWLLVAALVMVLLPVIYLGLIALLGYAVYLHARYDVVMLSHMPANRAAIFVIAAYVAPIVAGVVAVLFMIKPFFAPRQGRMIPLSLERKEQPVLFELVDKLADTLGAPRPSRIDVNCDVNASAGFCRGLRSFLGGDLVLTIGLPLVSGLTLRQLIGVMAHEFGHFTQGGAMRLTYVVRAINGWFARVVYERDAWDQRLSELTHEPGHITILLVVLVTRLMVWLSRIVLWLLMMVGHVVSCFMLRQMEFDADRCEARIVGGEGFESTAQRLPVLAVSYQAAAANLRSALASGELSDNFPALIEYHSGKLPQQVQMQLAQAIANRRTRLLDTHPADADRIASVKRANDPGIFHFDQPARVLFADYDRLCRIASAHDYQSKLGRAYERIKLTPTDKLLQQNRIEQSSAEALERFFQGSFHLAAAVMPGRGQQSPAVTTDDAKTKLMMLRQAMLADAAKADQLRLQLTMAAQRLHQVNCAQVYLHANVRIRPQQFGLNSTNSKDVGDELIRARNAYDQGIEKLRALAGRGIERIELARLLLAQGAVPGMEPAKAKKLRIMSTRAAAAVSALQSYSGSIKELDQLLAQVVALVQVLNNMRSDEAFVGELQAVCNKLAKQMSHIHGGLRDPMYPFDHAEGEISIARYLLELPPPVGADLGLVINAAQQMGERYRDLQLKLMGRLAWIAEHVEQALGLPPLEKPARS